MRLSELADRWWREPAPAERLATLRIITGLFATGYLLVRLPHWADFSRMQASQFRPIGVASILDVALAPSLTWPIAIAAVLAGVAFVAGYRFRWTGPLFAVLLLWVTTYRSSWGMIFHTENLLVLHVIALAGAPAADALSIDAPPIGARNGEPEPSHGRYGWPIKLMSAVTVASYLMAGIAKLRLTGLEWATSDFLQHYVAYDALRKAELGSIVSPIGTWLLEVEWLWKPVATASLLVELAAPLALLHRRIGVIWCGCALLFHLGVLAIMTIMFPYVLFGFGYASFFRCERLSAAFIARWRSWRAPSPSPTS